jgi:hypothetical protein
MPGQREHPACINILPTCSERDGHMREWWFGKPMAMLIRPAKPAWTALTEGQTKQGLHYSQLRLKDQMMT